jgi:lipopolysaccharide/colanic/teichoic acid biosynthesis glycosyltransferase
MERSLDILLSSVAILLLSPLLLPIVITLRFTGEGEVFYKQTRIGRGGKTFELIKFATMLKDSPNMGTGTVTVKDDPRVLPMGRFLRKSKINELPQLINILIGDMSVIGPRPHAIKNFASFSDAQKAIVTQVRPGLSGIGSIVFRDEENLLFSVDDPVALHRDYFMPYKGQLEEWYVRHNSTGTYFLLIWMTVLAVISPNSAQVWRVFPDLPAPTEKIAKLLNYQSGA